MLTFLLICILFCTVLGLASAVFSYLALKGAAEHADLAGEHSQKASREAIAAKAAREAAARHATDASAHADDAALALGKMNPGTMTIVNHYPTTDVGLIDGELFSYPSIERDCE